MAAGSAVDLKITWTVDGARPDPQTPGPCAAVGDLQVDLIDDDSGEVIEFTPVPCEIGQITFIDLPPRLDSVRVMTFDLDARQIGNATSPIPSGNDVEIDVELL